ncbi:MAG: hypothetical protein MRJ65_10200 [Candidatus Brocadiaceae bacterium]|nr:hypothetical protein [Candidatus Brocadiaceae bacterium]
MKRKKKILIISAEVWRDDTNGGNTLTNLFGGIDAEFAQVYCNPGTPNNKICRKYFQMTDFMMLNNFFRRTPTGKIFEYTDFPANLTLGDERNTKKVEAFYSFFRTYRFGVFNLLREFLWKTANWKSDELKRFILDFNPDIIFAPLYGTHYMLRLDRYVSELINKKLISFISDDHYTLKQFSFSPFYWIDRFILRHNVKRMFCYCDLVYVMTQKQINEYKKYFYFNSKLLVKAGHFEGETDKKKVKKPILIVYAGNIFYGRWKTLSKMGDVIRKINKDGIRLQLNIYTQSYTTSKLRYKLNDDENIILNRAVNQQNLTKIYHDCDIALHVESFDLKYKLLTRLSFSTKIIDCMQSGRAVMAICWKENAGYEYLKNEDAAICIDNLDDIEVSLRNIVDNPDLIIEYSKKSWDCGKRNHQIKKIQKCIMDDFDDYIDKYCKKS